MNRTNLHLESLTEQAKQQEKIRQTIDGLPFRYQEVMKLVYDSGFSLVETALITDSTINTVKIRLSHAHQKVNSALQ